jgi:Clp amino terminal domain, pathogenicity island component
MFERFTDRARRVVVLAQEEARLLNHNYIGTEHILLGLIHEGEGVAAKALESLGISLEAVRAQVEEIIGQGQSAPTGHIPFTPRAKKVLELSLREALQLGHNYIGTEHILLGLIREGEGVAAQVLVKLGADQSRVRQQVVQLLDAAARGEGAVAAEEVTPRPWPRPAPSSPVAMVVGGPPTATERPPAEPVRVVPLAREVARGSGWRLVLLGLEIWSLWVDLRYAVLPEAAGPLPPHALRWRLADDLDTAYQAAGSASGGDRLLQVHQLRYQPAPPPAAATITLTAEDATGAEIAVVEVPLAG